MLVSLASSGVAASAQSRSIAHVGVRRPPCEILRNFAVWAPVVPLPSPPVFQRCRPCRRCHRRRRRAGRSMPSARTRGPYRSPEHGGTVPRSPRPPLHLHRRRLWRLWGAAWGLSLGASFSKIILVVLAIIVVFVLYQRFAAVRISGGDARVLVSEGAILVDVRSPGEFFGWAHRRRD